MEWKLIAGTKIKPIYEINEEGFIRNIETGRLLKGSGIGNMVCLKMMDNSSKNLSCKALVRHVFELDYPGEWRPIEFPNMKLKNKYELSSDGRIRRVDTGIITRNNQGIVSFIMEDGTSRKFSIDPLIRKIFTNDHQWTKIKLPNIDIKPIYEVTKDGLIRNTETGVIKTAKGNRIDFVSTSGKKIKIYKSAIMAATYLDDNMPHVLPFSDDVIRLMENIESQLKMIYKTLDFQVIRSPKVVNMFFIHCDKFKYPLSVKKEYRDKYAIRTGKFWDSALYYGNGNTNISYTYKEQSADDIEEAILWLIHKKIYENPTYKVSRPDMYKPSINDDECRRFCIEFICRGFKMSETVNVCRHKGIHITRQYARKIVTKQRFRTISDLYFVYHGTEYEHLKYKLFRQ